jgi:hypothetical protein
LRGGEVGEHDEESGHRGKEREANIMISTRIDRRRKGRKKGGSKKNARRERQQERD